MLNEIPLKRKSLKKLLKNLSKRKQNLLRTGDVRILRLKKKGKPKMKLLLLLQSKLSKSNESQAVKRKRFRLEKVQGMRMTLRTRKVRELRQSQRLKFVTRDVGRRNKLPKRLKKRRTKSLKSFKFKSQSQRMLLRNIQKMSLQKTNVKIVDANL